MAPHVVLPPTGFMAAIVQNLLVEDFMYELRPP